MKAARASGTQRIPRLSRRIASADVHKGVIDLSQGVRHPLNRVRTRRVRARCSVAGTAARRTGLPAKQHLHGAIFLDKDGTVLRDVPYNVSPGKMRWEQRAALAIHELAALGLPLYIISNQSGVARGRFKLSALPNVARRLNVLFRQQGAALQSFQFCPFHPDGSVEAFRADSIRRKPSPGMLLDASRQDRLNLKESWFVGDILDDVEAGRRAHCRTILIDNGNETEWIPGAQRQPDATVKDLRQAARTIAAMRRAPNRTLPKVPFKFPEIRL